MRKLIASAFVLTLSTCTLQPTMAQQRQFDCASHEQMVEHLANKYGEHLDGLGISKSKKAIVELFVSEQRTWTVVIVSETGRACIATSGTDWTEALGELDTPASFTPINSLRPGMHMRSIFCAPTIDIDEHMASEGYSVISRGAESISGRSTTTWIKPGRVTITEDNGIGKTCIVYEYDVPMSERAS